MTMKSVDCVCFPISVHSNFVPKRTVFEIFDLYIQDFLAISEHSRLPKLTPLRTIHAHASTRLGPVYRGSPLVSSRSAMHLWIAGH